MRLGPLDDHRGGPPTRRGSRSSSRRPRREHPGFPTGTATDLAYAAAAAGVSAVPVVGGPAVELVQAVFGPPLAKRQQRWFEELADAVRILQGHDVPLDSAEFVTAVTQASRIALGTHLDEKIAMLKAAIIHAAFPDRPTDIITARFLRFVDELDPEHFVLLAYLRDPAGHFVSNNIPKPNVLMGGTGSIFAEARLPIPHLDIVLGDLGERGLADSGSWNTVMTSNGAWAPRSTALGNQLLDFVTFIEPPVDKPAMG